MTLGGKTTLCAECKGVRRLCGRPRCPILQRVIESLRAGPQLSKSILPAATPPSVFVGEWGYPLVRLGPVATPITGDGAKRYEDYPRWWGKLSIEDIIRLRARTIYSRFPLIVSRARRPASDRLLEATREAALSLKPVDAEFTFKKPPRPATAFDGVLAPVGLTGLLRKLEVVENPVVPRRVDQVVGDVDVKARTAILELYKAGVDAYYITRLFSLGMLGERRLRRIVPTRWSITAVDKAVGDALLAEILDKMEYSRIEVYRSEYIGNRYLLVFIPGPWSFEMIEIWQPRSVWVKSQQPHIIVNYELRDGRWRRPGVDGGYHAIRMPVLEFLHRKARQATVITIREITPAYYAPVGSWQIRESIRNALRERPLVLDSLREFLKVIPSFIKTPVNLILSKSILLRQLLETVRLDNYIGGD